MRDLFKRMTEDSVVFSKELATDTDEGAGGKHVFFAGREQGIWQVEASGGPARLVEGLEQVNARRLWTVDAQGVWWARFVGEQTEVWRRRFGAKESERVLRLAEALTVDAPSLATSGNGKRLLYSVRKEAESQLMSLQDVDE
jgi:hypothetical protein